MTTEPIARLRSVDQTEPVDLTSLDARSQLSARLFVTLPEERRALLLHVSGLLDEIAFGTVVIVMQDGAVMQIETSEKIRLR